jgi:hypothetical protein
VIPPLTTAPAEGGRRTAEWVVHARRSPCATFPHGLAGGWPIDIEAASAACEVDRVGYGRGALRGGVEEEVEAVAAEAGAEG